MNFNFWNGKKVFLTGHTGFKGSWASMWLAKLGADVMGYSLKPNTNPSLYEIANVKNQIESIYGDIRNSDQLSKSICSFSPDIVIHMAAQPLVRESYINPKETYETNVMGTINLFECIKICDSIKAVLNVTTDKCYQNNEWIWAYRENEPLGGHDPYSSSKACSELISSSYRNSFFNDKEIGIATARAGNVIGGGDWSKDRLLPDIFNAYKDSKKLKIRNPYATRPWQHVLEPIFGYLTLAEKLYNDRRAYSEAWNFGPEGGNSESVVKVIEELNFHLPNEIQWELDQDHNPHEANLLALDISKAKNKLCWKPLLSFSESIRLVVDWNLSYFKNKNMQDYTIYQIEAYENLFNTKE